MPAICDKSKYANKLWRFSLPVEVVQFSWWQKEWMITQALA